MTITQRTAWGGVVGDPHFPRPSFGLLGVFFQARIEEDIANYIVHSHYTDEGLSSSSCGILWYYSNPSAISIQLSVTYCPSPECVYICVEHSLCFGSFIILRVV